jgi:hypothetical protein
VEQGEPDLASGRCICEVTGDSIDTLGRNCVHLVPGSTYNLVRTGAEVIRNREDHRRTMEAR